jgi:hypothetical protein
MLGFRGHFSTRSRRFSTTLTVLRAARADFRRRRGLADDGTGEHDDDAGDGPAGEAETIEVISRWRYAGSGYRSKGDELLALSGGESWWAGWHDAGLSDRASPTPA